MFLVSWFFFCVTEGRCGAAGLQSLPGIREVIGQAALEGCERQLRERHNFSTIHKSKEKRDRKTKK